jgi:hypothetical protein
MNEQLKKRGFALLDGIFANEQQLVSYDNCPHDPYMGNGTRFKRFSQFTIYRRGNGWQTELLPPRAYAAPKKFNPIGGGFRRVYEPLEADFTSIITRLAVHFDLDPTTAWQLNVHQNRSIADSERDGQLTPEGRHRDGHEFVSISAFARDGVSGGHTRVWASEQSPTPLWDHTLLPGETLLLDDRAVLHDVTDIEAVAGMQGTRDILIVAYSRWDERWYGDDHDNEVLEGPATR